MDSGGQKVASLRGSASTRIDEKGRLKIPTVFRGILHARSGPDVFVTSVTGDSVRIYPMSAWQELEDRLEKAPSQDPSVLKFKDRVSYFGQTGELDPQGRVVIAPHLRQRAAIEGEVRVFGKGAYLEVWNEQRFAEKLVRDPWTDDDGRQLSDHGI
jgi:MraZ protein